jgi:methionyl-tRNA synthetase
MNEIISIDYFKKLDIRIAKIIEAENIPKSKKLIKLVVDIGNEQRTLVAGIADTYTPSELKGKLVPVLVNLQPATLMGVQSNGMILAAEINGKAVLLTVEKEVPPGSKVS